MILFVWSMLVLKCNQKFYEKLHITKAPADTSKAELQHKVLNQYPRSCSDLLTAVINEVAMIR